MMKDFPIVSIHRCLSYDLPAVQEEMARCLDDMGGVSSWIKKGDRVLIKPNLLFARPPEHAVTTHPVMVEAIARISLDCGAKVSIGDSPPLLSATRTAHRCGIGDVAHRLGIEVIEFRHPTQTGWHPQQKTLGISTPPITSVLQEMNLIINLPKLKAHQQMLITGAVKNLFGCVVGRRKAYWHFKLQSSADSFAAMLLALSEKIAPALSIVDAIMAMEGMGPGNGKPKPLGLLLAGTNPLAVDRVIADILGISLQEHFLLRMAQRLGFEEVNLSSIQTKGISLQESRVESFEFPQLIPIGFSLLHLFKGIIKYISQRHRR